MALSIQTNVNSLVAQENLRVNGDFQSRTIQRLTSGYRINSSGDDAGGLAVANKFRSDVAELSQGVRNANDGISQLQIIDGGLNNISNMLDRMKTLATQSASTTFTGSRNTLDAEFQALKTEITRQASNIGLSATNTTSNTNMSVYIGGGGSIQTNSQAAVDLSGSGNQVDAVGLGLTAASLLAGGTILGNRNISRHTDLMKNNVAGTTATQVFTFNFGSDVGGTKTVTVNGSDTGLTTDAVLAQLNTGLAANGVAAYVDSTTGKLGFTGSTAFTMSVALATGATAGKELADTAIQRADNTAMYQMAGQTTYGAIGAATVAETLKFTKDSVTTTVTLDATTGATSTSALAELTVKLRGTGITAVLNKEGTGINFQSATAFTMTTDSARRRW